MAPHVGILFKLYESSQIELVMKKVKLKYSDMIGQKGSSLGTLLLVRFDLALAAWLTCLILLRRSRLTLEPLAAHEAKHLD